MPKIFPITTLKVEELDQVFETAADSLNPNIRKGTVTLPPNLTSTPKVYNITVYTNGKPTAIKTTVTVKAMPEESNFHPPVGASASAPELEYTGGTSEITVTFNTGP